MDFSGLAKRYLGETADNYDASRDHKAKWKRERSAIESILAALPARLEVLDIPVGTGRFIELYQAFKLRATGVDVSADMLTLARKRSADLGAKVTLLEGDIRAIPASDGAFDIVICVRFLNWIEMRDVQSVLSELARVSNRYLIVSISHFLPLREVDFLSVDGMANFVGQLIRRFKTQVRHRSSRRGAIVHEQRAVKSILADTRLVVTKAFRVDDGAKGVASFVYLLEKTGGSGVGSAAPSP